jgi:hypothetical protein
MLHLGFDHAASMLPPDNVIHSVVVAGCCLMGCDLSRERVFALMNDSPAIRLASEDEALLGHRLLIRDQDGRDHWIELDDRNMRVTLQGLRDAGVELRDESGVLS